MCVCVCVRARARACVCAGCTINTPHGFRYQKKVFEGDSYLADRLTGISDSRRSRRGMWDLWECKRLPPTSRRRVGTIKGPPKISRQKKIPMAFQLTMGQCASIPVLLAQGMTHSEIARRLNCTWATVHHWVGQESPFDELRSAALPRSPPSRSEPSATTSKRPSRPQSASKMPKQAAESWYDKGTLRRRA